MGGGSSPPSGTYLMKNSYILKEAYKKAIQFTRSHYENFPVISFLIPRDLQQHIAIIYWFARTADDIADEGTDSPPEKIDKLDKFEERLKALLKEDYQTEFEFALSNTIRNKKLSAENLFDLLSAFKQDVTVKRYKSFSDLSDYCRRSANPVGRLILELYNIRSTDAFYFSDKICTALQITNFLQDISIDYKKGRIYIPYEDLLEFGIVESHFENEIIDRKFSRLMEFQIQRTEKLFDEGENLLQFLHGRQKYEIRWTIFGGKEILKLIRTNQYDVYNNRPKLTKKNFIFLLIKSIYAGRNSTRNIEKQ